MFFGSACYSELPISTDKPTAWNGDTSDINFIIDQLLSYIHKIDQQLGTVCIIDQLFETILKIDQESVCQAKIDKQMTTELVR